MKKNPLSQASNGAKQSYYSRKATHTTLESLERDLRSIAQGNQQREGVGITACEYVTGPYGVRIGERRMAMAVPRSHCSQARTGLAKQLGGVEVEVAWIQKIQGAGGVGRQPPPLVENQAGAQMVGRGGAAGGRIICGGHWTVSRTAAFVKFSRAAFAVLCA